MCKGMDAITKIIQGGNKMKVITAPNDCSTIGKISVFLAGGISDCWNWQEAVINKLKEMEENGCDMRSLVLFNPRRPSFDVDNPGDTREQIHWEIYWLTFCDIFSMYFCNSDSVQPICMYELGRNLLYKSYTWGENDAHYCDSVLISIEEGYKRTDDVLVQTELATFGLIKPVVYEDPNEAVTELAQRIYDSYVRLKDYYGSEIIKEVTE